jgi:hypothetical protein
MDEDSMGFAAGDTLLPEPPAKRSRNAYGRGMRIFMSVVT